MSAVSRRNAHCSEQHQHGHQGFSQRLAAGSALVLRTGLSLCWTILAFGSALWTLYQLTAWLWWPLAGTSQQPWADQPPTKEAPAEAKQQGHDHWIVGGTALPRLLLSCAACVLLPWAMCQLWGIKWKRADTFAAMGPEESRVTIASRGGGLSGCADAPGEGRLGCAAAQVGGNVQQQQPAAASTARSIGHCSGKSPCADSLGSSVNLHIQEGMDDEQTAGTMLGHEQHPELHVLLEKKLSLEHQLVQRKACAEHATPVPHPTTAASSPTMLPEPSLTSELISSTTTSMATEQPAVHMQMQPSPLYRSPLRHVLVSVKVEPSRSTTTAHLDKSMPVLIARAVEQACPAGSGGGPMAADGSDMRPICHSYVAFPGCYQAISLLGCLNGSTSHAAASIEAALQPLLAETLPGVDLLGVKLVKLSSCPGIWCHPVAVTISPDNCTDLSLVIDSSLISMISGARHELRVVVSSTSQPTPISDSTVTPGQLGWPEDDAVLSVELPASSTSTSGMLQISLLSTAALVGVDAGSSGSSSTSADEISNASAASNGAGGVDAILTSVPLLVLPEQACQEVWELWLHMVQVWQQRHPGTMSVRDAAAQAYLRSFVPFVHDYAMLLEMSSGNGGGSSSSFSEPEEQRVTRKVLMGFLDGRGMEACMALLQEQHHDCRNASSSGVTVDSMPQGMVLALVFINVYDYDTFVVCFRV
jgi:hypothetical protein